MSHGESVAIRMKKVPRPRNLRKPWCHLSAGSGTISLHVGVTRGIEEMKKARAWLGRAINYSEYLDLTTHSKEG